MQNNIGKVAKKYYWIKLKQDFFDLPEIDFLLDQKNGCEYVVLYQKLCLLTANHKGKLAAEMGDIILKYDAAKISKLTGFEFDTVCIALNLFKQLKLIYESDDDILTISCIDDMVGEESEWALRKRLYRAKKLISNSNYNNDFFEDNVLDNLQDNEKTFSDKSKRKSKSKILELDKEKESLNLKESLSLKEDKKDKKDKEDKPTSVGIVFDNLHVLTKELINRGFITETDFELSKFNQLMERLSNRHDYGDLCKVIGYVLARVPPDNKLDNKLEYFEASVVNNLQKMKLKHRWT